MLMSVRWQVSNFIYKSNFMDLENRVFVIPHFHYGIAWISADEECSGTVYKIFGKVMEIMEKDY